MQYKKRILFLGASIAQGKISKSYVKMLKERLGTKQYKYINHGVAGYESFNVLQKLSKAFKIMPDFVILLVGTNDVLSSLDPGLGKLSGKIKKIPHKPALLNYSNNMTKIIKSLKQITHAKIAIASLPVLGENLNSIENKIIEQYNAELQKIAEIEGSVYLPVHEQQKKYLINQIDGKGRDCKNSSKMIYRSLVLHYLFFKSLDTISRDNGFLLLTDGIHMNSMGAKYIADEIEGFIRV